MSGESKDVPSCWICYETEPCPKVWCNCKGDMKYSHRDCLNSWLQSLKSAELHCQFCGVKYEANECFVGCYDMLVNLARMPKIITAYIVITILIWWTSTASSKCFKAFIFTVYVAFVRSSYHMLWNLILLLIIITLAMSWIIYNYNIHEGDSIVTTIRGFTDIAKVYPDWMQQFWRCFFKLQLGPKSQSVVHLFFRCVREYSRYIVVTIFVCLYGKSWMQGCLFQ